MLAIAEGVALPARELTPVALSWLKPGLGGCPAVWPQHSEQLAVGYIFKVVAGITWPDPTLAEFWMSRWTMAPGQSAQLHMRVSLSHAPRSALGWLGRLTNGSLDCPAFPQPAH